MVLKSGMQLAKPESVLSKYGVSLPHANKVWSQVSKEHKLKGQDCFVGSENRTACLHSPSEFLGTGRLESGTSHSADITSALSALWDEN